MSNKISLVKSIGYYKGVRESLLPFKDEIKNCIFSLPSIVIKINMVITKTPAYVHGVELSTTPVDSVRSFIEFIIPFYKGSIIIAEEPAWGDTKEGFRMYGFTKLARQYPQIKLLDQKEDETIIKKIKYQGGELELPFSKTLLEALFLVSITRPKTHCTVGVTAGLKNVLVGAIQKYSMRRKIHNRNIHYIISSISDFVYPDFQIIDGYIGMQGGGPVRGDEIQSGWALSSFDPLASDSLATYLMGFNINDIGYLVLLNEKNKGLLYPNRNIKIIGDNPGELITKFKPHRNHKKIIMWR